jgi:hypothetical protein
MKVLKKLSGLVIIILLVSNIVFAGDLDDPYKKCAVSPVVNIITIQNALNTYK